MLIISKKNRKKNLTKYQTVIHFGFISLIQAFFISTTTLQRENGKKYERNTDQNRPF
jgi:uncharacterized protein (UPF0128 family)